jgi:hypothetical protein
MLCNIHITPHHTPSHPITSHPITSHQVGRAKEKIQEGEKKKKRALDKFVDFVRTAEGLYASTTWEEFEEAFSGEPEFVAVGGGAAVGRVFVAGPGVVQWAGALWGVGCCGGLESHGGLGVVVGQGFAMCWGLRWKRVLQWLQGFAGRVTVPALGGVLQGLLQWSGQGWLDLCM